MIEYTCTWTIGDVSIWCYGAEVTTLDDLDCTLVLDGDCNLIAVRLQVDRVTGKTVEVSDLCLTRPAYIDANAQAIWRSALASVERSQCTIRERAKIPDIEIAREELPYTDRAHIPVTGAARWGW